MKILLAAIAILLSANLAAQDDQFKIKGFYAGMPLEEFEAVAESHGALMTNEAYSLHHAYFMNCKETYKESRRTSPHLNNEGDEVREPADLWSCHRYENKPSRMTLGGIEVYYVYLAPYEPEAGDFDGHMTFKLPNAHKEKLFERLSKRFGEPISVDRKDEIIDEALWLLGKFGDVEYGLRMWARNEYRDGKYIYTEDGIASVQLTKRNRTAAEQYKQAKELEAQNDF